MHRQPDRAALGGNCSSHALPDPPVGVGAEAETAGWIEFLHSTLQAEGAFLHEIQQLHAPLLILLGHRDHQPKIGLDHVVFGATPLAQCQFQLLGLKAGLDSPGLVTGLDPLLQILQSQTRCPGPLLFGRPVAVAVGFLALQFLQSVQFSDGDIAVGQLSLLLQQGFAALHQPGKGHLLLVRQQIHPPDVLQIQPQQIRGAAAAIAGFPGPSCLTGQRLQGGDVPLQGSSLAVLVLKKP